MRTSLFLIGAFLVMAATGCGGNANSNSSSSTGTGATPTVAASGSGQVAVTDSNYAYLKACEQLYDWDPTFADMHQTLTGHSDAGGASTLSHANLSVEDETCFLTLLKYDQGTIIGNKLRLGGGPIKNLRADFAIVSRMPAEVAVGMARWQQLTRASQSNTVVQGDGTIRLRVAPHAPTD